MCGLALALNGGEEQYGLIRDVLALLHTREVWGSTACVVG